MKIVRTKRGGAFTPKTSTAWGNYYRQVDDPEGVGYNPAKRFKLPDPFPKLPNYLWRKIIKLYRDYVQDVKSPTMVDASEVQVNFLRNMSDLNQWRVLVPAQVVSGASVNANMSKLIDLESGEEFDHFPPVGWATAGTSHSHNTMGAFFSHTDDESELHQPGMHIVVGRITSDYYEAIASIVLDGRRFLVRLDEVVDVEVQAPNGKVKPKSVYVRAVYCDDRDAHYDETVKEYITVPTYKMKSKGASLADYAIPGTKGESMWATAWETELAYEPRHDWVAFDYEKVAKPGKEILMKLVKCVLKAIHYADTSEEYDINDLIQVFALLCWISDSIDIPHLRYLTDCDIDPCVAIIAYTELMGKAHEIHSKLWEE